MARESGTDSWLEELVEGDCAYTTALEFAQTHKPPEDKEYGWVVTHANTQFEQIQRAVETVEGKADSIITYVGAFAGISAVTFAYQAATVYWVVGFLVLPTLVASLLAISAAVRARAPALQKYPANTKDALRYAEDYAQGEAPIRFALQTWAACEAGRIVAREKGKLVRKAFGAFAWGAWLLLVPCVGAIVIGLLRDCPFK